MDFIFVGATPFNLLKVHMLIFHMFLCLNEGCVCLKLRVAMQFEETIQQVVRDMN